MLAAPVRDLTDQLLAFKSLRWLLFSNMTKTPQIINVNNLVLTFGHVEILAVKIQFKKFHFKTENFAARKEGEM